MGGVAGLSNFFKNYADFLIDIAYIEHDTCYSSFAGFTVRLPFLNTGVLEGTSFANLWFSPLHQLDLVSTLIAAG